MALEAIKRMMRERKLLADRAAREREERRLSEVKAAFFEGMKAAIYDLDPDACWLESDARRNLYAGPPMPDEPSKRAAIMIKATHGGRRRHRRDPQRDPGRVIT